jgi:ABC-2 type transport system ATP-binding protein
MRADLAAALLHRPSILFLDEPTIGLDAVSKLAVRQFLQELNRQEGVTIILTTHDLDDIETLCRRVMVIGNGRILTDGSLASLRQQVGDERVLRIDLRRPDEPLCPGIPARMVSREGGRVVLRYQPQIIPSTELIRQITAAHDVEDLFLESTPIEEIVAALYEKHRGETAP